MLFSSMVFVALFLPLTLGVYYVLPRAARNSFLLLASILFYAWGDSSYLSVLIGVVAVSFAGGCALETFGAASARIRLIVLSLFVCADVAVLFYFKYFDFVCANLSAACGRQWNAGSVILPLGISFYVFQGISYLVDVFRGTATAERNPFRFALFVSFFPQLIAGPILRYHDVASEFSSRRETLSLFAAGIRRFVCGLAKKVLVANSLATVADSVFNSPACSYGTAVAWIGSIAYSLQLYFDFSGYSDMAIGLGRMFGFSFSENFNYPYLSLSFTEFWRRWHISLSVWMKEYLYIPLGGSRVRLGRNLLNLLVVFAVSGLWHGAAWTFVAWGLLHAFFVIFEKVTGWSAVPAGRLRSLARRVYLLAGVNLAWAVFRSESLGYAWEFVRNLAGVLETDPVRPVISYLDPWAILVGCLAAVLSTGCCRFVGEAAPGRGADTGVSDLWLLILFGLTLCALTGSTYNPFIYFRF